MSCDFHVWTQSFRVAVTCISELPSAPLGKPICQAWVWDGTGAGGEIQFLIPKYQWETLKKYACWVSHQKASKKSFQPPSSPPEKLAKPPRIVEGPQTKGSSLIWQSIISIWWTQCSMAPSHHLHHRWWHGKQPWNQRLSFSKQLWEMHPKSSKH